MSDFPSHPWVTTGTIPKIPWGAVQKDMMIGVANTILFPIAMKGEVDSLL